MRGRGPWIENALTHHLFALGIHYTQLQAEDPKQLVHGLNCSFTATLLYILERPESYAGYFCQLSGSQPQ